MKTELKYFKLGGGDEEVAKWASEQSHGQFAKEQLITPVAPSDIYANYAGIAAVQDTTIVGYVGAKQPAWVEEDSRSLSQISTLVVPEEYQGQGIASLLVGMITYEVAEDWFTPFAFCNPVSKPSFESSNYVELKSEKLPPGVASAFGNPALVYNGPIGNNLMDSALRA